MNIVLTVVLLLAAIFLVAVVLIQGGKSEGMSGAITGGSSETFLGKNKSAKTDKLLDRLTVIVATCFVILVLVIYVVQDDNELDLIEDQYSDAQSTVAPEESEEDDETDKKDETEKKDETDKKDETTGA